MASSYTPEVTGSGFRARVQTIGGHLAGMVMPNIGAIIAWGLITAMFIPVGWVPNENLAELVGPMITYLLPVLIGYTGVRIVVNGEVLDTVYPNCTDDGLCWCWYAFNFEGTGSAMTIQIMASADEFAPEGRGVMIDNINLQEQTRKVLATLTPREEQVLRMRFGIGERSDHTLEEVGQKFTVTRERIRQIEAKALRKLRHPSRSKRLKTFMES